MSTHSRFVIAPSLARLIQKERGGERVLEGYFPDRPPRSLLVRIEESRGSLILQADDDEASEERADLPLSHAQALLAVSQGQVEYVRTTLVLGSQAIELLHFLQPDSLDLLRVAVAPEDEQDFDPLPWFGPDVSAEPAYEGRRLALEGRPDVPEADLTDAALHSLLDLLENRLTTWSPAPQDGEAHKPRPERSPPSPTPVLETQADQETDDPGIEDEIIRELARALQPRRG